ncbi:MAG: phosphate ABC transporter substrate-binding protein [Candidatus Omnitrophota bacterium]|jgi:phosphate transport system substrate-binding protein|nr:MAG: phosphate ABC transporter substrate-binding protein [Candidatus Omnitrophota bacterium]
MRATIKLLVVGALIVGFALPCYAAKIVIEGSTTVLPIAQKAAEVFMDKDGKADISVRGGGSSVGIASMIDGTCDIAGASRAIKDSELDKAIANSRNPVAHVVAMDGIAVIVNPSNNVNALTKKQVKDIYTGKISNWADVGGKNEQIVIISRDTPSGTYEAFGELALEKDKVRPDALLQASNQAVASVVSRTPGAIGYVGLGYVNSAVKAVTVNGIMASKETVLSGTYPISRPLFMYTNGQPSGEVKAFMDFVKSSEGQRIAEEQGFVGLK